MDSISKSLLDAQVKANALFAEIVASGRIAAGNLESELNREIHQLAKSHFGLRRHWHKRIARAGENIMLTYRHGNGVCLREPDADGRQRHWILEIHFIDRQRRIGGFFEELLTVD
jgi:hypothetical protein